ncbi:MAG: arginine--tRNA ligase [Deltaproteobacteria bacterium]|nr:arginine--tRNA ligase [Deltaproteobacteria bacterium]MBU53358.1 arginine--tRNA ligase [Deltaproteobacteria bacterium]
MSCLNEQMHQAAHNAIRAAMDASGLQEVEEIKLSPPADPSMGDLGMACHPFARVLRKNPKVIAEELAAQVPQTDGIKSVEALNGYLNLRFDPTYVISNAIAEVWNAGDQLGKYETHKDKTLLIEFSGPNTNKPQHLGHARNNVLGLAMSNILEAVGYNVVRANIINDRGIHICKSMLAYKLFGEGATPESTGKKGDYLVGDFYVLFDKHFEEEYAAYCEGIEGEAPSKEDFFNNHSDLGRQAQEMLRAWEAGDEEVRTLWKMMNGWVFDGFDVTYKRLGINFDWVDYESDTYSLGKGVVEEGLTQGLFEKREDGAVVCDLEKIGRDGKKVLLRSDGTSVYMTQDLGTAQRRFEKFSPDRMTYVVADEQNYHFQVLFGILNLIGEGLGDRCHHMSYGMVELPEGKMKSRKGNVVDADILMDNLQHMAAARIKEQLQTEKAKAEEKGVEFSMLSDEEIFSRAEKIGQAGLKFYLLKFAPTSRIQFDPARSIEFQGETGPYCLYTYARGNSIARKVAEERGVEVTELPSMEVLSELGTDKELAVGKVLMEFPLAVQEAAEQHSPARLAQYLWKLANVFSSFYQDKDHNVKAAPSPLLEARLALIMSVQAVLKRGITLLGFDTIEQM